MNFFGSFPIKTKLIILFLIVSFATLLISSTFFVYNDLKVFKENLLKNLTVLAGTVGANSRAAVYFEDKEAAAKILSSLKEDSQIQYAAIYDSNGEIFVTYENEALDPQKSQVKKETSLIIKEENIELKRPIILKDKLIGEIFLSADLREYNAVLRNYLFVVGIILTSTLGVAIIISFILQRILSRPIQNLAEVTKEISSKNDYSIRVDHESQDEIGDLSVGFNQMISGIEKRDRELENYQSNLESMVEGRTKELSYTNKKLRFEITKRKEVEEELREYKTHLEDLVKKRTEELASTNGLLVKEVEQRGLAENYLKLYSKELIRSNQELHDFASIASHDLQEPLRKIITFGDRLATQISDVDKKGVHYLERMQNAAQRMKQFIDDLLEYSKIETKGNVFKKTDLNKIFSDTLEILEIQINQSQAQIHCDPLPTLEVDAFQIGQLFQNLIGNAIKYKKGEEPPVVEISARAIKDDFWEIEVKDNGIGFDEKYLDRIFKPFERLHGKMEYEGSGMGLTICKKIIKRHGGNITASSVPQEGSTFKITLPEAQKLSKKSLSFPLADHPELTQIINT